VLIFLIFWPSKIHVSPTGVISSLSPPRCCLSSGWRHHTVVPCHTFFPLSQDELDASASSSCNPFSRRISSRAKTEVLNPYHHHRLPSPDRLTPTLHYYKKIISTLPTFPTTQPHLYFTSSLAKASCQQSSTCCHRSLSPLSYTHGPFTQRHPRWWTSWPSFTFWITYRHMNSRKKIFWNITASRTFYECTFCDLHKVMFMFNGLTWTQYIKQPCEDIERSDDLFLVTVTC
jgi:hypothetical protein